MVLYLLLIICCTLIIYHDIKTHTVPILYYIGALIMASYISISFISISEFISNLLFNLSFIFIQTIFILGYIYLKYKKINIFSFIGQGDYLFFVVLSVSFSPLNFVVFQILSFLIILAFQLFFMNHNKLQEIVPLAGYQACIYSFVIIIDYWIDSFSRFDDAFIMSIFFS
jgi:hypothetical protein